MSHKVPHVIWPCPFFCYVGKRVKTKQQKSHSSRWISQVRIANQCVTLALGKQNGPSHKLLNFQLFHKIECTKRFVWWLQYLVHGLQQGQKLSFSFFSFSFLQKSCFAKMYTLSDIFLDKSCPTELLIMHQSNKTSVPKWGNLSLQVCHLPSQRLMLPTWIFTNFAWQLSKEI